MNPNFDITAPLMLPHHLSQSNHPLASGKLLKFLDPVRHTSAVVGATKKVVEKTKVLGK
jgi:hypothetical protein